jgi:hypothetical protein
VGIVVLLALLRGEHAPPWTASLYFGLLFGVIITVRVIERVRADRSVLAIKRAAHRRLILEGPMLPSLRPLRWLALASLSAMWTIVVLIGMMAVPGSVASRIAGFGLLGVPAGAAFGGAAWMWGRRRRQLARGEPRSFNPSSCLCGAVSVVAGRRASAYASRHLRPERYLLPDVVDEHWCDLLGIRWVRFTAGSGLRERDFPVLFRIGAEKAPQEPAPDVPGTGFYL